MDPWPLVVAAGFGVATALVIVLARASTARWERQRTVLRRRSIRREVRARGRAARTADPAEPVPGLRRRRSSAVPRPRRARGVRTRRSGGPRVPGGS